MPNQQWPHRGLSHWVSICTCLLSHWGANAAPPMQMPLRKRKASRVPMPPANNKISAEDLEAHSDGLCGNLDALIKHMVT